MTIDINKLRRLAQAATPGPWYATGKLTRYVEARIDGGLIQEVAACGPTKADGGYGPQQEANASLIAAANPATISELLDRLEAAEKSDAESLAMYRKARDERDALRVENETLAANLRGKHSTAGATYAHLIAERDALRAAVQHEAACVEAAKAEIAALRAKIEAAEQQEPVGQFIQHPSNGLWEQDGYGDNPDARPLYPLPGAQNVPTALLVAVADLVAQMEIVSRVGFVDTPDDKDSCAAFCVAEGTWLELVSAVESLTAALAAALEIKS